MHSEFLSRFRTCGKLLLCLAAAAMLGACGWRVEHLARQFAVPDGRRHYTLVDRPVRPGWLGGSTSPSCALVPAQFTNAVWPEMASSCMTCHAAGRVAGGTRLVFIPGGDAQQNYPILRDFVAATGSLVLTKSIGQPSHGGGAPYGDATSQPYKDLQALMPVLQQSCTGSSGGVQPTGFWAGVQFASTATTLARASVLFAGRNPTASESAAAAGGTAALRQTIRGYMQGAAFNIFSMKPE